MTVEKLPSRDAWLVDRSGNSCCYLVKDGGHIYGLLEKEPGRGQPWKAFHGVGRDSRYLGSSYTGRGSAVELVMDAVRKAVQR
jgi:hypothetical protein